jgi:hypothetical protein
MSLFLNLNVMTQENFELLLNDLYDIYNPEKKSLIPGLLISYNGREFDAIYTIYFKYNSPRIFPQTYNKNVGTEKHIKYLIDEYSKGNRVLLTDKNVVSDPLYELNKKIETIDKKYENSSSNEEIINELKNKNTEIEKLYSEKLNDLKDELVSLLKSKTFDEDEDIEINIDLSSIPTDIKLPNFIKHLSPQTKFIVFGSDNKPYGLEIKEVIYDFISKPGKCIKEIIIGK